MAENRVCLCIDLKSFYASVECVARGLDPLRTNLVVADASRTEKTICLAVSPSLKACGIPGRPRLFEVIEKVGQINAARRQRAPGRQFAGESCDDDALRASPELSLGYITATPRMSYYLECSARIYELYLRHLAPEDIHVYSIDEVFLELTGYLPASGKTAWEYAQMLVGEIYAETGITATAGIGTNLYLAKVAMDIVAKHAEPDERGARIAALDELRYRELLWDHRPLTDFWRVGHGYAKKLEAHRLYTMGDIARCSLGGPDDYYNEDLLYRLFGVNAELLIDHAWGWEPLHDGPDQGLPALLQQHQQRAGALVPVSVRQGAAHRARDDGAGGARPRRQGRRHGPGGALPGLRRGKPGRSRARGRASRARSRPTGTAAGCRRARTAARIWTRRPPRPRSCWRPCWASSRASRTSGCSCGA
jgi:nucleotidyltransferase/DNA polymerase involved in DNA repair